MLLNFAAILSDLLISDGSSIKRLLRNLGSPEFRSLNIKQAKASDMFITSKIVLKCICQNAPSVLVNGVPVVYVSTVKYLGVLLDSTLSWHDQVVSTSQQAMSCLARLKMNSKVLSASMRRRLVAGLILPIFDYCSAVFTNISGTLQLRLQRKFNACIRFIFGARRFEHITPYRRRLGWLTLRSRREFLILSLVYKMLNMQHHKLLHSNFKILLDVRGRAERRNQVLHQPACRTVAYENSFLLTAVREWNQLPSDLVAVNSSAEFQTLCYKLIFDKDI
ncbi:uncharacterized protein LOC123270848 [Cotesia glomerata]|uniref:uncharacterized protein LOC123270848 n=1 Tax=Cotesia glomerata TaxID=32391 RepID=UPI001D03591A|nr:uncharacterized protein LOC123270848 [Cotesia glomerata]